MTRRRPFTWFIAALLAAGIVMLTIGILDGEMRIVDAKAIRVCLECIGIG